MAKGKKFGAEEIVTKLRLAEVELSKGQSVEEVCKKLQISPQSFYRWRKDYNTIRPHSSLGYKPPAPETLTPNERSVDFKIVS